MKKQYKKATSHTPNAPAGKQVAHAGPHSAQRGLVQLNERLTAWLGRWYFFPLLSVVLVGVYFGYGVGKMKYTDDCLFGGDTWEYQSMAVNYAKGYGVNHYGGVEDFASYKFGYGNGESIPQYMRTSGINPYRTPGYPVFLGMVYKVFGVSPLIAKRVHFFLLVLVAALLPYLGYRWWGKTGVLSGLLAGPVFLLTNYRLTEQIMTEPLIVFSVFVLLLCFVLYHQYEHWASALLLGWAMGLALLVKGSFVFIPLLGAVYLLYQFYKKRNAWIWLHLGALVLGIVAAVAPWSIYASLKAESFVLLSTQGPVLLLDSHNEFSMGWWGLREWAVKPESFYNTQVPPDMPAWQKVLAFYGEYPERLYTATAARLVAGFSPFIFFVLFVALYLLDAYSRLAERWIGHTRRLLLAQAAGLLVLSFLVLGLYPAEIGARQYSYESFNRLSPLWVYGLLVAVVLPWFWLRKASLRMRIPVGAGVVFLNFFFLSSLFVSPTFDMYWNRFTKVIDFLFILLAIHYLLAYLQELWAAYKTTGARGSHHSPPKSV